MSSVNSSSGNRSNNDDQIRQLREEYKKREAELIKKHNQEIKKLSQGNIQEVDRIRTQGNERLDNYKQQSRETVSRRDAKFQREIDNMKKFHSKQLERMMKENDAKVQQQRQASEGEVEQTNLGKTDRVNELHQKYNNALAEKSENFNQQVQDMRSKQKNSYETLKEDLEKRHLEERNQLRSNYQEQIVRLENDLRTTRQSAQERLRGQETRHMNDKTHMQSNFMSEIEKRESNHAEMQDELRASYKNQLGQTQQEYRQQVEAENANRHVQSENFRNEVNQRLNNRERRLERELANESDRHIREETKTHQRASGEVRAWRDEYEKRYQSLNDQKNLAMEQAKKTNVEDLQRVHEQASDAIVRNNRYMQNVADTNYLKSRQAIDALENEIQFRTEQQKETADTRIHNIRENSFAEEERLKKNYEQNLDVIKQQQGDELREIRLGLIEEKNKAIQEIKIQANKKDADSQRRVEEVVSKYEKRISELNDQFVREKKLRDNRERQLIESLNKSKESEKEALVMKYTEQNRQAEEQHRRELEDISRRHNEQMNNLMNTVKKT